MQERIGLLATLVLAFSLSAHGQAELSWESVFPNTNGLGFAVNPLSSDILYAASQGTFYVTYDAGVHWQARGSVPPFEVRQIAVSPGDTSVILLYANGSIFRSDNAGFSWTEVLNGITMDGETIEFHPLAPDTVYYVDFASGDLYKSNDGGASWNRSSEVSAQTVCSLSINRHNPRLAIAGAGNTRINRSTDGGLTWETVREPNPYFSEIPKLKWDPTDSLRAFAATYLDNQYSVFRTQDGSASWQEAGIFGIHMWALDVEPVQGRVFVGSFGDPAIEGIFASYDGGNSYQKLGDATDRFCWMLKAPSDSVVYALSLGTAFGTGSIYRLEIPTLAYLAGSVRDSVSRLPVEFASVTVEETGDWISMGNGAGTFTVALLPGTYTLRVSVGAVEKRFEQVVFTTERVDTLDVLLNLDVRPLAVEGRVLNDEGEGIPSAVQLSYARPGVDQLTLTDTSEADGRFRFDGLNSLYTLTHLSVRPLVLPYIGLETDTVLTDAENLLHLSRADIIRMAGPGELADGERYRLVLEGLGYSSIEIRAGDPQFSSAVVEASTRRTLIWYARLDSTPVAQSVLDSLASVCQTGSHLIITGQNLLEFNSAHALFQQNLGVAFAGSYAIAGFNAQMTGVAGNPVGNGLTFQFLRAAQPSPDRLTLLSTGAARAFTYGTDAMDTSLTAGVTVDNTGGGGKALVMGINLEIASGALVAEVLRRTFAYFEGTTEVDDHGSGEPDQFALYGNYPNPFNPTTTISFWLPRAEPVTLRIYSILGQEIATLLDGEPREAGLHRVSWDGASRHGGTLAGGVYVCRIEAGRWVASSRMLLLK